LVEAELNPLLAFNIEDVRMLSFHERAVVLTVSGKSERVEFESRELLEIAVQEWLGTKAQPPPEGSV
jgi:hypothetical protein